MGKAVTRLKCPSAWAIRNGLKPKHMPPRKAAASLPADAQTKKPGEKRSERELQNQRKVIGNHGTKRQAHGQREGSRKRIGGAPRQVHGIRVIHQVGVKGILKFYDGSREVPQKPGVLKVIAGIPKQTGSR